MQGFHMRCVLQLCDVRESHGQAMPAVLQQQCSHLHHLQVQKDHPQTAIYSPTSAQRALGFFAHTHVFAKLHLSCWGLVREQLYRDCANVGARMVTQYACTPYAHCASLGQPSICQKASPWELYSRHYIVVPCKAGTQIISI